MRIKERINDDTLMAGSGMFVRVLHCQSLSCLMDGQSERENGFRSEGPLQADGLLAGSSPTNLSRTAGPSRDPTEAAVQKGSACSTLRSVIHSTSHSRRTFSQFGRQNSVSISAIVTAESAQPEFSSASFCPAGAGNPVRL